MCVERETDEESRGVVEELFADGEPLVPVERVVPRWELVVSLWSRNGHSVWRWLRKQRREEGGGDELIVPSLVEYACYAVDPFFHLSRLGPVEPALRRRVVPVLS
jgi:hypothetical protein